MNTNLLELLVLMMDNKPYLEQILQEKRNQTSYQNLEKTIAKSKDTISIGAFAKLLNSMGINIGRNRLFDWFRANGYIMSQNGENQPKQIYIDNGLFVTRQYALNTKDAIKINITTYITGKGQLYFFDKIKGDFKYEM